MIRLFLLLFLFLFLVAGYIVKQLFKLNYFMLEKYMKMKNEAHIGHSSISATILDCAQTLLQKLENGENVVDGPSIYINTAHYSTCR